MADTPPDPTVAPPYPRPRGFACPHPDCGGRSEVLSTTRGAGVIRRRRRCVSCGRRMTTVERPVPGRPNDGAGG